MTGTRKSAIFKTIATLILILALGLLGFVFYLETKSGQKWVSKKATKYLSEKLKTTVKSDFTYSFPDWIQSENLLLKDRKSDTLLAVKRLRLDIDMLALLNNEVRIDKAVLENTHVNINEENGIPSYQFILDAFAGDPGEKTDKSKPLTYYIKQVDLKKSEIKYNVAGNNVLLNIEHLNTGFDVFDLEKSRFFLKKSNIKGLSLKGIVKPSADSSASGNNFHLRIPDFSSENLNVNLTFNNKNLITQNASLKIKAGEILTLNNSFEISSLDISSKKLSYTDTKAPKKNNAEFDINNLALSDAKILAKNLNINGLKKSKGTIETIAFTEKSGFELKKLSTDFYLKNQKLELPQLEILTGKSSLKTKLIVSMDTLNPEKSSFSALNIEGKIAPSEATYFAKNLENNENFKKIRNTEIQINGQIDGNTSRLTTKNLSITLPEQTALIIAGKIHDFENLKYDLEIKTLKSTRNDILKYIPADQLPANLNLPEHFTASGTLNGSLNNIDTKLLVTSDIGTAKLDTKIEHLETNPVYNGKILFAGFDAGKLLKNPSVGKLNGYFDFTGKGFSDPQLDINGRLKEAAYDGKKYENIEIIANLTNKKVNTTIAIDDKNANASWTGVINLKNPEINISGKTKVDFINLKALGLTKENIEVKGNFDINELLVDPKSPKIDLSGSNVRIYRDDQLYPVGDIRLFTLNSDENKALYLNTDFMRLNLSGRFEYDQLTDIVVTEIIKYFKIPDYKPLASQKDYSFNLSGKINYDPVFTAFLPGLKAFEPITAVAKISSENPLLPIIGSITLPSIKYDSLNIKNLNFDFSGNGSALSFKANSEEILQNDFRIRNASLTGSLENNVADFALSVKDSLEKEIHALHGFVKSENNALRVTFDEEGTRLFYEPWAGNPYGFFEYSKQGLKFSDVIFTNAGNQIVRLSTLNDQPNGPLHVFAQNLDLNFFARAIYRDSTLLSGTLDADIELVNYMSDSLSFTGDYAVKKLHYQKNELGDLEGIAKSISRDKIYIATDLKGTNNDVKISGNFFPNNNGKIEIKLTLEKLDLAVAEPFMKDILYEMKGQMKGDFSVTGNISNPEIAGDAIMKTMEGRIAQTGAFIKLTDQKLNLINRHILFKNLKINDISNQTLLINGDINLEKIPDFEYSIAVSGKDFKLVDAMRGQNELFYGEGFFSPEISVKGKNTAFKVEGDVSLGKKTVLTLLMEEEEAPGSEMQEIVEFVNSKKTSEKDKKNEKVESKINFANTVNINVDVPNEATLNILMDPLTGDLLTANGSGKFNLGFDNKGDLFMLGQYDIVKGKYALTYQVFKKEFEINAASKSNIIWTGDPMAGQMDITAFYNVPGKKSPPFANEDLKNKKLNIPVRVDLTLKGPVSGPEVNFEVVLRENDLGENAKTAEEEGYKLINDKGEKITESGNSRKVEMNDRAVFLLVTHTFNSETFKNNLESINNYEDLARRKASELISNSLNNFASGLIKGFDLNLGLESGVNTSNDTKNTNLSLGVSKKLANERLVISVGKNFELENKDMRSDEIFDNLQANWLISKDGRYRFNIFRKTQNDMVIEGSVIETGIGFIVAIDYETWKELMKRSK